MPAAASSPPIANDGSAPASWSATVSIEVVVVLPFAPAIAMLRPAGVEAASAARAWERCRTRRPAARAAASSTLSSRTAEEMTTVSAPSR